MTANFLLPQSPFFVWAHFYDPHHPHVVPPLDGLEFEDPYDAEIAYVDQQIGRLKTHIESMPSSRDTAWMVISDHGEAFNGEHGEITHGLFLFDSTMRIPFIFQPKNRKKFCWAQTFEL